MSLDDTKIHAKRFGWPRILESLGVPRDILDSNRHHPCPSCGGRDRFRLIDAEDGVWLCNQCRPKAGSGFDLLMLLHGWDFKVALREVRKTIGTVEPVSDWHRVNEERKRVEKRNNALAWIKKLWGGGRSIKGTPAEAYIHNRGLAILPVDARFTHTTGVGFEGVQPCMITAIRNERGLIVALHRTFITEDGLKAVVGEGNSNKQLTTPVGTVTGAAARVSEWSGGVLGVAEGIETALAAREQFNIPVWACISAHGLESFMVPKGVSDLRIFGDRDEGGRGQEAAFKLAARYPLISGVHLPVEVGDWLDVLNKGGFDDEYGF